MRMPLKWPFIGSVGLILPRWVKKIVRQIDPQKEQTLFDDYTVQGLSVYKMAERGGFEPPVHLCEHTHDFQSCSLSHSDISPVISIFINHINVTSHVFKAISGGERGIRTPVGACGPQIDFESIPLRPLRYLSTYRIKHI